MTERLDPTIARYDATTRAPVQVASAVVGAAFLLVGILGFVPGVTAHLGDIGVVGHDSDAELLGLFGVNVLHNVVHLLFGIAGLAMAANPAAARTYLLGGGAIYLVLWVYGLVIDLDSDWNFVALDTADNWLHLGLGVGMVALGFLSDRTRPRAHEHELR